MEFLTESSSTYIITNDELVTYDISILPGIKLRHFEVCRF